MIYNIESLLISQEYLQEAVKYNKEKWNIISPKEAHERNLFGPVYHGTTPENIEKIKTEGIKFWVSEAGVGDTRHGFPMNSGTSYPLPVHLLGYGVYFTEVKDIAKHFGGGSMKNVVTVYLDIPRLETINFGSYDTTMKKWYMKNGYDPELARIDRVKATQQFTDTLKSKYDAVLFKGKGIHRLLDGNQIVVFDPSRIYIVDEKVGEKEKGIIINPMDEHREILKNFRPELLGNKEHEQEYIKYLESIPEMKVLLDNVGKEVEIVGYPSSSYYIIRLNGKKYKVQSKYIEKQKEEIVE